MATQSLSRAKISISTFKYDRKIHLQWNAIAAPAVGEFSNRLVILCVSVCLVSD